MWKFRTGGSWRAPDTYGNRSMIYDRFRARASQGIFENLMNAVISEAAARGDVACRPFRDPNDEQAPAAFSIALGFPESRAEAGTGAGGSPERLSPSPR